MITEKLLGQKLGPYQIESLLGSGGMASVYRARDSQGQLVALKVLSSLPEADAEILVRFEREAHTAARLRHPAIVRVLDAGQVDSRAFMAMALVEGQSLADQLAQAGPLDETTAADIAWQVADALHYAHSQGVVHRDVKPSNILLTPDGRALLTDFGVALAFDNPALTRTGYIIGTPAYMAPEQAAGDQPVDGRADLYALGVVLYQMVTGRPPFQGSTPQVLHAHVYDPPPAPSTVAAVSPVMETIIMQALAKDSSQRFQTGAAMAKALAKVGDQTSLQATRTGLAEPGEGAQPTWFTTRNRLAWLLLPLLLAAIIIIWQFTDMTSLIAQATITPGVPITTSARTPSPAVTLSPTQAVVLSPPSPTPLPWPPGTLLRGSGSDVFRLNANSALQRIYDRPTFLALGFTEAEIQTVNEQRLQTLPQEGELTRLLQGQDQSLYWVIDGQRWRIGRWQEILAQQGYQELPASPADPFLLEALPLALDQDELPSGTLLEGKLGEVYRLFANSLLRPFATPELVEIYGYSLDEVVDVPAEILPLYQIGPPLTQLLQIEESEAIFLIEAGQRRPVPEVAVLERLGYEAADIQPAPAEFLAGFGLGEPVVLPDAPATLPPAAAAVTMLSPSPSPTATPSLPLTVTPCPQPITTTLAVFLTDYPLQEKLGCPRTEATTTLSAWQSFEQGLLLWREDLNLIYVLGPDENWFSTGDTWRDGDAPDDPTIVAPDGLYQPVRGFGRVWRERPGMREALGWATAEEVGSVATLQEFTGGLVWQETTRQAVMILFSDGTYQIISQ